MLTQQVSQLRQDEGKILKVYDDATESEIAPGTVVKGHPTIGIGRALDVHGISDGEAEILFNNDIERVESALTNFPWYRGLNDVRKGVMVNLAFNMGVDGLLGFHRMITYMFCESWREAADELQNSDWWHQVQVSRRERLKQQLLTGML